MKLVLPMSKKVIVFVIATTFFVATCSSSMKVEEDIDKVGNNIFDPTTTSVLPPTSISVLPPDAASEKEKKSKGIPESILGDMLPCSSGFLCGEATAHDGKTIRFKAKTASSASPAKGLLVFHFGGPGTNAYETLESFYSSVEDNIFLKSYDLVGVEQRGSDPVSGVDCGNDEAFHYLKVGNISEARRLELSKEWISGCPDGEYGSLATTRDIDSVLEYVNADTSIFVGISYGGIIGVLLGSQYSHNVDAILLDSPSLGILEEDSSLEQMRSFSQVLNNFFSTCDADPSCLFSSKEGESEEKFLKIVDKYSKPGDFLYATALTLYNEDTWSVLDAMLSSAENDDYVLITRLADFYHMRFGMNYPPSAEVFQLTFCKDGIRESNEDYGKLKEDLLKLGAFGELVVKSGIANMGNICAYWDVSSEEYELDLYSADIPVLLLASTNDPASSWKYSEEFISNKLSSNSGAVVIDEFSHSLWLSGNECVDRITNAFIESGVLPNISAEEKYSSCSVKIFLF